jgi:hypothetical protein
MVYDVTTILSDVGIDYKLEGSFNKIDGFSSIEEARARSFILFF